MIMPLNRNIIVKPQEWKEVNDDGLIRTKTTSEMPDYGVVLERSEDCQVKGVKVGSKVFYSKYAGSKLYFNKEEMLVLNEEDLLGVEIR